MLYGTGACRSSTVRPDWFNLLWGFVAEDVQCAGPQKAEINIARNFKPPFKHIPLALDEVFRKDVIVMIILEMCKKGKPNMLVLAYGNPISFHPSRHQMCLVSGSRKGNPIGFLYARTSMLGFPFLLHARHHNHFLAECFVQSQWKNTGEKIEISRYLAPTAD